MVGFTASSKALLVALLAIVPSTLAQTHTDCNPLNSTSCPSDLALGVGNYTMNFINDTPSSKVWNTTAGTVDYADDGAEFTINQKGDSPTIQSNFYLFFGQVEVIMKAAGGTGIISSIVLESDDLDEVDWEFMGGNTTSVETNYFGKGDTSTYDRAIYYSVDNPMTEFHNYTVDWNQDRLQWLIDGNIVRTLNYTDAQNGTRFPQTPMTVRLGIWAGGDKSENSPGTVEWAGGETDYKDGPFTMTIKSVRIADAHTNVTSYHYGDTSGSFSSIKMLQKSDKNSTKPISSDLDGNQSQTTTEKAKSSWDSMSKTAKIAIGASCIGAACLGISVLTFCCVKQRKIGRAERDLADQEYEKQTAELLQYRAELSRRRTEELAGMNTGSGIGGRMKRLSQQLGMSGGRGNYQGDYQRF